MKKFQNSLLKFKNLSCHPLNSIRRYFNMKTLETLNFDNQALKRLPIDPIPENYVRTVRESCFSKVQPTPVKNPQVVAVSESALSLLDLEKKEIEKSKFAEYFSGNKIIPGADPAAHCYCGHQFGVFAGQLGDGAAIYLGEIINSKNERWEIQLKGAGKTPYSRTADGRKVLRSSIREFLCSEAMHFLGIPTTRAGCCITSDSKVERDMFYDGNSKEEKCTIVLRIAPSFIRIGSFEIFKTRDPDTGRTGPSVGRTEILHTLLKYVIESFYPEIWQKFDDDKTRYAEFYKELVLRTARLVALWQSVGFCHGVLNTDNMSILGLTIDYGPFGFLEMYDPNHICNSSDSNGHYTFIRQPTIGHWNLRKLAEAIQQALPLKDSEPLLQLYDNEYRSTFLKKMRSKLGLIALELPEDGELVDELHNTMQKTAADFTNTFLCIMTMDVTDLKKDDDECIKSTLDKLLENCYSLEILRKSNGSNLNQSQIQSILQVVNSSPEINRILGPSFQKVLRQAQKMDELRNMTPEIKAECDKTAWMEWLTKYRKRVIEDVEAFNGTRMEYREQRMKEMENNNPRFILRNYIAQEAINAAEKGDFSLVQKLVAMLQRPYDHSYNETATIDSLSDKGSTSECKSDATRIQNEFDKTPDWGFSIAVS